MSELSYLQQVRQLRILGKIALKHYSINVCKFEFINHGENTTFKIVDKSKKKYLLRIHRENYHSKQGILQELKWLTRLDVSTSISVQTPIANRSAELITKVDSRYITVLNWVEGRRVRKSLSNKHMEMVADLMRELHTSKIRLPQRPIWDANALIGNNPFFGLTNSIAGISTKEQVCLNNARKILLKKLNTYGRLKTCKRGPIHADLHFGNFFLKNSKIAPIDFDDCGTGFHMYDIAVFLCSLRALFENSIITKSRFKQLRDSFLTSYNRDNCLDLTDLNIISVFELTRQLVMIGWLNSRSDNPKFSKALPIFTKKTIKELSKRLNI